MNNPRPTAISQDVPSREGGRTPPRKRAAAPEPTQGEHTMKTARRTRRTVRTAGLVAVAAAAAFSLTACQDDGTGADDAAGSPSASASSQDTGGSTSGQDDSGTGGSSGSDTGSGGDRTTSGSGNDGGSTAGSGGGDGDVQRKPCDVRTTTVRFQQTGGSAPVILLKATNTGGDRCDLYGYPFVGYPDAQAPIEAGGGQPQSVVSLAPGKSAYSALSLEPGNNANMHREKKLTVELATRDQHGTGHTATLTAPGAGLSLSGESSRVSYWNTTPELAMQ
ncbi:hypothetical protein DEH18_33105 [Streptomyces sp. NHF165]|nr:hypothetical protein DEH18_33105 [Streptomyces sp. NHF165]